MSIPLYKRQGPPTKQAHTPDTSGHFGDVALCVRADEQGPDAPRRAERARAERVPRPHARRMPCTPTCSASVLWAGTHHSGGSGAHAPKGWPSRRPAPLLLFRLTSRCVGELVLAPRRPLARLRDGDNRNATRVEFWTVSQKIRPDFDMALEFCAVFRRLLR